MTEGRAVVAIYDTHTDAEVAIRELHHADFPIEQLSLVGRESHPEDHVVGYYNTGVRMRCWGTRGAFWSSVWGLPQGAGFFALPGTGPVLVAGPLVEWMLGALECAMVTEAGTAIGAGLLSLGIPKGSVLRYETAIKASQVLLVAHGTTDETAQARRMLRITGPRSIETHTLGMKQPCARV